MGSFNVKHLAVVLQMASGQFGEGGNTVTINGDAAGTGPYLGITASVTKPGGKDKNKLDLTITGMKLSTMDRLTVLGFRRLQTYNNVVTLYAGSRGEQLSIVFAGEITTAHAEFANTGVASFKVEALTGYYPALLATSPTSVQGESTIESLMQQFASDAGYSFKNDGVSGSVHDLILSGSPIAKMRTLATQVGIDLYIDDRVVSIAPKAQPKKGNTVVLNPSTGLLGYPAFTNDGITAKCLFNPQLELAGLIKIESIVPKASGIWRISKLEHTLEACFPGASQWFTTIDGVWVQE